MKRPVSVYGSNSASLHRFPPLLLSPPVLIPTTAIGYLVQNLFEQSYSVTQRTLHPWNASPSVSTIVPANGKLLQEGCVDDQDEELDVMDWDVTMQAAPPIESGVIDVDLEYVGPSIMIYFNDPSDE